MSNLMILGNAPLTMSSREIAELTGKQISHVHRDIRAMLGALVGISDGSMTGATLDWDFRQGEMSKVLDHPEVAGVTVEFDSRGYAKQVNLPKDLTITLVAGYNVQMRHAIVKRWQELEVKQAKPVELSRMDILKLAMESEQARIEAEHKLALAAPKVEFVDKFVQASTGSRGFREVCKLLKANEAEFRCFVIDRRIMYRLAGKLTAHQNHIDAGRFEVKAGVADNEHAYTTTKFTAKGVEWIAGEWAKHKVSVTLLEAA